MNCRQAFSAIARCLLAATLLALAGCAGGDIDDPDNSNAVLSVQKIEPSIVQAVVAVPANEVVDVTITSFVRAGGGAEFADVTLTQFRVIYNPPLATGTSSLTTPITATVPAAGTLTLTGVPVLSSADVPGAVVGSSTTATLLFEGQDLLGKPASASGTLTILFL